jgi:hypothetical protein
VLFIIFMPRGIMGLLATLRRARPRAAAVPAE